jgi:small subunit ribosomal protein S6
MMNNYESIFIMDPDLEEAQAQATIEKVKGIITQNKGEIVKVEDWGKRKLAYDVKKKPRGHYILTTISGSPALLSELHRNFRVMDAVIKFQSVRLDEHLEAAAKSSVPEDLPEEEPEVGGTKEP